MSRAVIILLLAVASLAGAGPAHAQDDFKQTRESVVELAQRSAAYRAAAAEYKGLRAGPVCPPTGKCGPAGQWDVYFIQGVIVKLEVFVDDATGRIVGSKGRARPKAGYEQGIRGYLVGSAASLWLWLALCALFLAPFIDVRRPLRALHFDLAALLGFAVSLAFFSNGKLSVSVPIATAVLAYLFGRLLWLGLRPPGLRGPLVPHLSGRMLAAGLGLLVVARIVLAIASGGASDVGFQTVEGAKRLNTGKPLYENQRSATYGPLMYVAYAPFELAFRHSGEVARDRERARLRRDNTEFARATARLPAARAAAIFYDLLTMLGLFLAGRRLRAGPGGRQLGIALAYAWAAFPFTLYGIAGSANDFVVSAAVALGVGLAARPVLSLLAIGVGAGAKFVTVAVVPLMLRLFVRLPRRWLLVGAGVLAVLAGAVLLAVPETVSDAYHRTVGGQLARSSPLTVWGRTPSLHWLQVVLEVAGVLLVLGLLVRPRRRDLYQTAALGGAVLVLLQITLGYWFYFYLLWFLPLALVAFLGGRERAIDAG